MTVFTDDYYVAYTGDGATTRYDYSFPVLLEADMTVTLDEVVTTAYSIYGLDDDGGGYIVFDTAPADGVAILLKRFLALTQPIDIDPYDKFPAQVVEGGFDRVVMMVQQTVTADNLYAPYIHYHKATDSSYDNTQTSLGAQNVQTAIDAVYSLSHITNVLYRDITDDAGDGTPEGDLNATDFTAQSGTTMQPIDTTTAYIFYHKDSVYNWVGPRDTSVGIGGDTTAIASQLHVGITSIAAAVSYDNLSSGLTAINVQTAIDEVAAVNTGFKNVLINPQFRIDQRGIWLGNWDNVSEGEFGPDRWYKSGTDIVQIVEAENLIDGGEYVLSVDGVITSYIIASSSPLFVTVPNTATRVQLEQGSRQTNFEVRSIQQELAMCQRYYEVGYDAMPYQDVTSGNTYSAPCGFRVTKRVKPSVTLSHQHSNRFPTISGSVIYVSVDAFNESRVCNSTGSQGYFRTKYAADAEIT